jgi:two-component system, LytTR family, response regulator
MNCIAIDDEPLALDIITEFCAGISYINLIGTFTNASDAAKVMNSIDIDLLFLDIHMPKINGIDFLRSLYSPPLVIFTTAYKEHAFQGFEYDAVDYLVKPFGSDRFIKAVNKAYQLMMMKKHADIIPDERHSSPGRFIMVKVEYSTVRIDINNILYIEGLKDYVKIYTTGKVVLTKTTMKNIAEKLPADRFLRVHKSFIVALEKIELIENNRIVIGKGRIPVGDSYKSNFTEVINRNLI